MKLEPEQLPPDDISKSSSRLRFPVLHFLSTSFFVLGSVLYLVLAITDHQWGRTLRDLPVWLRTVDDDLVWANYRLAERFNESLAEGSQGDSNRWLQFEAFQNPGIIEQTNSDNDAQTEAPTIAPTTEISETPTFFPTTKTTMIGTSAPEMYEDEWWDDLPVEIQNAYSILGYNETIWDERLGSTVVELNWDALTPEQQEAAQLIGYTQDEWDDDSDPTLFINSTNTTMNGTETDAGEGDDEVELEDEILLTPSAAVDDTELEDDGIGFDTGFALPSGSSAGVNVSHTTNPPTLAPTNRPLDVTPPEDEMVNEGGANNEDLSTSATQEPTSAVAATLTPGEMYYDLWWSDLPPEIQEAYTVLGYTEALWNSGGDVPAEDLWWDEMSAEQREAASFIGYTREMWNGDGTMSPTLSPSADSFGDATTTRPSNTPPENVEVGYYDDYWWDELPPDIQAAARELGYDQTIWDIGGYPETEDLLWDELTPSQQKAAELLGYDRYSWNEYDEVTGESTATADDYVSYDDDYVFQVAATGTWVSRYQIIYFCAAWCFVFMGVLDLIREQRKFHILMITAGLTGVASAMLVEKDLYVSNILNTISVHFFMLEAFTLFGSHRRAAIANTDTTLPRVAAAIVSFGDINFALGSLADVILSYLFLLDETSDWNKTLTVINIVAAIMWLICSLIYMWAFFFEYKHSDEIVDWDEHGKISSEDFSEEEEERPVEV